MILIALRAVPEKILMGGVDGSHFLSGRGGQSGVWCVRRGWGVQRGYLHAFIMGSMAFCLGGGGPPEGACCPGGGGYFQRAAVHPLRIFSGTALSTQLVAAPVTLYS